jgi:hypothetical protein
MRDISLELGPLHACIGAQARIDAETFPLIVRKSSREDRAKAGQTRSEVVVRTSAPVLLLAPAMDSRRGGSYRAQSLFSTFHPQTRFKNTHHLNPPFLGQPPRANER